MDACVTQDGRGPPGVEDYPALQRQAQRQFRKLRCAATAMRAFSRPTGPGRPCSSRPSRSPTTTAQGTAQRRLIHSFRVPMQRFDFIQLSPRDKYKILIGSVVPRRLPWSPPSTVKAGSTPRRSASSTLSRRSRRSLRLGVENHATRPQGHHAQHPAHQEFTVNIVSDALVEAMNVARAFRPRVSTN